MHSPCYRILHVVKTSDGGQWAIDMAEQLQLAGHDVHVLVPKLSGAHTESWKATGCTLHLIDASLPVRKPWTFFRRRMELKLCVEALRPDVIHSHFFSTALMLRLALGRRHIIPRLFQVPGPLHLEHGFFRKLDLLSAGTADHWIASSGYIAKLYMRSGVRPERVFLSYYGERQVSSSASYSLRKNLGIADDVLLVGNVSYMYPPRRYLLQKQGIKQHETIIDAFLDMPGLGKRIALVLIGGEYGRGSSYERALRDRAGVALQDGIFFTGELAPELVQACYRELDCVLHVPSSENCGGVCEPLQHGVPVVAASVGGLPEVVIDNITGRLLSEVSGENIRAVCLDYLQDLRKARSQAARGGELVESMFSIERTTDEIQSIYRYLCESSAPLPTTFDSVEEATQLDSKEPMASRCVPAVC